MITFIKNQFLSLVTLALVFLLLIERCDGPKPSENTPTVKRDTVYIPVQGTVTHIPSLVASIPIPVEKIIKEVKYYPDTTYLGLLKQYKEVLQLYFALNAFKDTLSIDSIGSVFVTDSVSKNLIMHRSYEYDLKYPVITNTITLPAKARNQLYVGGSVEGNANVLIDQINAGVLLKTRRDQIYGLYGGMDYNGKAAIGLQSYWKINLRRK